MAKTRSIFVCSECGRNSPKEMGRCPGCGNWNTFVEEVVSTSNNAVPKRTAGARSEPRRLSEIQGDLWDRIPLPMEEFSRVLGGGIVPGSLILIGGEPGIGKCVTGDTRILDPRSGEFRAISDWENNHGTVLAVDTGMLRLEQTAVTGFYRQGKKPIIEVKTRLGRVLRCTHNHPLLTPDGWIAAGELAPGKRIAAPRSLPYFGNLTMPDTHVKLIAYILSDGSAGTAVSVTSAIPEVKDELEEIAQDFGMSLVTYPKKNNTALQYRFTNRWGVRKDNREKFAEILCQAKKQAGFSWAEWARRADVNRRLLYAWAKAGSVPSNSELERLAHVISASSSQLGEEFRNKSEMTTPVARFLESVNLRYSRAANKSIPDCIFQLPRDQLALFLRTIFTCDGSVYLNKYGQPGLSYSTISLRLAQDIQHLLLRFDFIVKLRTKKQRVNGKPYTAYELQMLNTREVQRFIREIGILGRTEACHRILDLPEPLLPSTQQDTIPTGTKFWRELSEATQSATFAEIRRHSGILIRNRRHDRPLSRYLVSSIAAAYPSRYLNSLANGDVYWDEIESITPGGEEEVYDISVANHHNFMANDLIVHNSTLLLEVAAMLAESVGTVLYVSGEESIRQIKMRADRLSITTDNLLLVTETNIDMILQHVHEVNPRFLIVDSIQTTYSDNLDTTPGSVGQVKQCTSIFQQIAKDSDMPIFLVGHVTKEGNIAGPRVLEHIVDTVLYLEGDAFQTFRLLRSVKNRFGATSEVGVFEMQGVGMVEVQNPSEAFLAERVVNASGSAIAVTIEGTRPLLAEVQALATPTSFANPRRTSNGIDLNRLLLITAVLTRRAGIRLAEQDIFVNVIGGLRIDEPASDLAVALALASSVKDRPLPADMAFVGEIGLSGELRAVSQLAMRMNEAAKLGFRRVLIPKSLRRSGGDPLPDGIQAITARSLEEAMDVALHMKEK